MNAAVASHDRRGQLAPLTSPTLVIGAEEDGLFSIEPVKSLVSEIENAELKILPGAQRKTSQL